jgi:methyl-accepting chemotaxis protein
VDLDNRLKVADHAISIAQSLIAAAGPVSVVNDRVFAGSTLINGNEAIVDAVYAATLFGCTIFHRNVRIATRAVAKGESARALGTTANDEVTALVYRDGGTFRGQTTTLQKTWAIVYVPLVDAAGARIGMISAYRELVGLR